MAQADDILDRVSAIAGELKLANLQPQIAACRELMQRHNGIDVAVFGRFKAGKSSFLNHLAGRAVLPIGVVPLTAVITRLRFGETDRAQVRFLNGTTETISPGDIGRYVGENENPNNQKQVAAVEVELPELKPLAPLQFVDTPGLGSAFAHNTEVALNWLPNVGAALVAVSSDAPLSARDLELLGDLRPHTPKIVLLLTKADLLTEPQRAEVMEFVHQQLNRSSRREEAQIPKPEISQSLLTSAATKSDEKNDAFELPVFFYSIKPELAGLKLILLKELFQPLLQHQTEAGGQIARHKLSSLVSQTLNYLQIALATATQTESARQALRERLDEERRQFGLFREELQVLAREWSAKALDQSLERLQPTQRTLQAKVTSELQAQFAQWQMRLPLFLDAWLASLQAFLTRELIEVSHTQRPMFCEPAQKAGAHFAGTVRASQDRSRRPCLGGAWREPVATRIQS